MKRWFKKNYKVAGYLALFVIFIGWTSFIQKSDKLWAAGKSISIAQENADNTNLKNDSLADSLSYKSETDNSGAANANAVAKEETNSEQKSDNPNADVPEINVQADARKDSSVSVNQDGYFEPEPEDNELDNSGDEPLDAVEPEVVDVVIGNASESTTPLGDAGKEDKETEEKTDGQIKESYKFPYVIADVNSSLNIRSGAGQNYDIVGEFAPDSYATVIEKGEEWTLVSASGITGYAATRYLLFDEAAIEKCHALGALKIKVTASVVNIRGAASIDSAVFGKANLGDTFKYHPEFLNDEWYEIEYEGKTAYISKEFTEFSMLLKQAQAKK